MADEENYKRIEDNAELHDRKSFDNSELQQLTSESGIRQTDEAMNSQSLAVEGLQYREEGVLRSQNVPEKEANTMGFQVGFPFTDLVEATSTHIDSILENRNTFQQENNFYSQQPFIAPDCKTLYEVGAQQQIPFEFENYANQILGQKPIQPFVASNNTATKTTKNQITDVFALSQATDNSENQQVMSDDVMNISVPLENLLQETQTKKHAHFETLHDDERLRTNEAEVNDDTMNKNLDNWDSGHQQFENSEIIPNIFSKEKTEQQHPVGELVPKIDRNVIPENEQDFTINIISMGLQLIDGKLFDVIGGLSNVAKDPERGLHLPTIKYQKLEETEIPGEMLHRILENSNEFQNVSSDVGFSKMVHSDELIATEIHKQLEHSVPGVMAEIKKIKGDVIHFTMANEAHRITEEIPSVQDKLETTSIGKKCSEKSDFFESETEFAVEQNEANRIKEPMKSVISENDPENVSQEILGKVDLRKQFVSSSPEEKSGQSSMNLKSVRIVEDSENVDRIQDEHQELVESKELQQHACYDEQQEKATNIEIEENVTTPNKSLEIILEEKKEKVSDANALIYESKTESEENKKKSNSASNILDRKHEIDNQEGDENTAVDNGTKCRESVNIQGEKNSEKGTNNKQKELKNISKDASNVTTLQKTTKKTVPATTATAVPTSRNDKKSSHLVVDKKSMTKSSVNLPLVSKKSTILKEKNVEGVGLKHAKNVTSNTNNVKISKQNIMPTRTPKITSRLIQKKFQESVTFAKSQTNNDAKIDMKNRPKDTIKDYQKTAKEMENDEKELLEKKKKIGIIDLEPLVWTEILVPTYEQIWKSYEATNQIANKTDVVVAKTVENELKIDDMIENLKTNNSELLSEMKKDSEFMETEVIKSITLSDRDEINIPQCFAPLITDKEELILDPSDSSKTRKGQNQKVTVEEEIVMEDGIGKREIEISGSIPIKSSEVTEISLKMESQIPLEQKTLDATTVQSTEADTSKNCSISHENLRKDIVLALKPNISEIENETEVAIDNGTDKMITVEDVNHIEGINGNKEEVISAEKEKSEIKHERYDDDDKESRQAGEKAAVLAGSGAEQQLQPELEINDGHRRGEESRSKHNQRKGQFRGMYSDVPEECRLNVNAKDNSSCKIIDEQQNYPQQGNNEISNDKIELKDNYQQQSTGNQNHSRKQQQQQQQSSDINGGYNQNYSGHQGHRKRNKRNRKTRNW